ncbi:MAG: PD-(D/E)XK nuclease family protein [Syntrophobacterales bacterium]|nr:PD-(D/E)XK nuclease family protein [Syntrophobacterales bacterium]
MPEKVFPSGAELQEFLLASATPDSLILVPHQRLARQLWHRQRLAALARGARAWEPLTYRTLGAWWQELLDRLWLPQAPPPPLVRLRLWRRAIAAAPPLEGIAADLTWAAALEEAYQLLSRHRLAALPPQEPDSALLRWRREVTGHYEALLREEGWLSPGSLPALLLNALEAGRLPLPSTVSVAGLEAPAPGEEEFLSALARHTRVMHLRVRGHPEAVREAWVLKDMQEEMAWVAARLVEAAVREGLAPHRVAVTSPAMGAYQEDFRRVLRELLGPAGGPETWRYNFSLGPRLTDTPLFAAATLPVSFFVRGERREDLAALFFSPLYRRLQEARDGLAAWDRRFREEGPHRGWEAFRRAWQPQREALRALGVLEEALTPLAGGGGKGADWVRRLRHAWQVLGFPGGLSEPEEDAWRHLAEVLDELSWVLEEEEMGLPDFHAWLTHAAGAVELAGEGREETGFQVLGLLETRGLEFDRVFCLGMTSGNFPGPPRPLPLLSPWEKRQVLGGTAASQYRFAKALFAGLLGTAPHLVLTRPAVVDGEEQVGTYLWVGQWEPAGLNPLSTPHPAWLAVPAVRAALAPPPPPPEPSPGPVKVPLPAEVRITHVQTGLSCPCRFLLEVLLEMGPLPEEEGGLGALERGQLLHKVVARFVRSFGPVLEATGSWDDDLARRYLEEAVAATLDPQPDDPHLQAERLRWLGDDTIPGLLPAWLELEKQRFREGWRWVAVEQDFSGLAPEDCSLSVRGRIDRLDHHPERGEVVVWDYKSGNIPTRPVVFVRQEEYQLPGYLLAVRRGAVAAPEPGSVLTAGFIRLKSPREGHLGHEDYRGTPEEWEEVMAAWEDRLRELARRLEAGVFPAQPAPAPRGANQGACAYCPYPLLCGYRGAEEEAGE